MKRLLLSLFCLCLAASAARAQNWPQFRGAGASGVAEGRPAPVKWDATKAAGLLWKTPIPGLSHASPVVWNDRVFIVTAVSSDPKPEARFGLYGDVEPVKDDPRHAWKVYALDKKSGKVVWERTAYEGVPKVKRHPKSSHAASTPVTDGKYLVVNFGSEGLYAYDMNGKQLWKQDLGVLDPGWFYDPDYQWEYGSSPVIYKNLVIVQADIQKNSFIAAYDLKTGKQVWRTAREGELPGWGTPTVYVGKTRAEVVTNGTKAARGYDPLTGKELWRLSPNSEITTPTPIVAHDLIYVTSGYRAPTPIYAIRPGAVGDISLKEGKESGEFVAWSKARGGPYMATPLVYGDLLYILSSSGVVTAYDAKAGERVYQQRIADRGGAFTASPVGSDGKLYLASEDGEIFVVKAGPKHELLSVNPMGEVLMATPAISDGMLIVRGINHVFAVAEAPAEPVKKAEK